MFTWLIGFLSIFLYQVLSGLYVRFSMFNRTSGLDYLESNHIFTHTTQYTFSYIYRSLYRVIHIMYIIMLVTRLKNDMCLVFLLHN